VTCSDGVKLTSKRAEKGCTIHAEVAENNAVQQRRDACDREQLNASQPAERNKSSIIVFPIAESNCNPLPVYKQKQRDRTNTCQHEQVPRQQKVHKSNYTPVEPDTEEAPSQTQEVAAAKRQWARKAAMQAQSTRANVGEGAWWQGLKCRNGSMMVCVIVSPCDFYREYQILLQRECVHGWHMLGSLPLLREMH
jgi:hypothetical protein